MEIIGGKVTKSGTFLKVSVVFSALGYNGETKDIRRVRWVKEDLVDMRNVGAENITVMGKDECPLYYNWE